jgi:proline iminopeptidase
VTVKLFFDVEGAKLRPVGERRGEVPTLLLLHGGTGFDHSEFKISFSQLADIAQVVYFDHRGNGRSDSGAIDAVQPHIALTGSQYAKRNVTYLE